MLKPVFIDFIRELLDLWLDLSILLVVFNMEVSL